MSWELFKKVNKKRRGVELINVSEKIGELADDGIDCSRINFSYIRRIFLRIDKKLPGICYYDEKMGEEKLCGYINLDYSYLEKTDSLICNIFLNISYYFHNKEVGVYPEEYDSEDEDNDTRTNYILRLQTVVKCRISRIIYILERKFDLLDSTKGEISCEDVSYAICVLKKTKTELLEIGKDIARLYVRD